MSTETTSGSLNLRSLLQNLSSKKHPNLVKTFSVENSLNVSSQFLLMGPPRVFEECGGANKDPLDFIF